jgi:hypothetical protein
MPLGGDEKAGQALGSGKISRAECQSGKLNSTRVSGSSTQSVGKLRSHMERGNEGTTYGTRSVPTTIIAGNVLKERNRDFFTFAIYSACVSFAERAEAAKREDVRDDSDRSSASRHKSKKT